MFGTRRFPSLKRFVATAALLSTTLVGAQEPDVMTEWLHVGAEQTHTKYSAIGDITVANVGEYVRTSEDAGTNQTKSGVAQRRFQRTRTR